MSGKSRRKRHGQFANRLLRDEAGATAMEYGLIAALISITIIMAATQIGGGAKIKFEQVASEVAK